MKYKTSQIITNVECQDWTYEGYGLVKQGNYSIFVENLLPTEKADIKIKKATSKYAYATVLKHLFYSPIRKIDTDRKLLASGAAPMSNVGYKEQLNFKEAFVNYLFYRNNNWEKHINILASEQEWNYRNKITIFCESKNNQIDCGLYARNSHDLVQMDNFELTYSSVNSFIQYFIKFINLEENKKLFYNVLNSFTCRYSYSENKILLILNTNNPLFINSQYLQSLINKFPDLVGIMINNEFNNKNYLAYGQSYLIDKIGDLTFKIEWNSFFQINTLQTKKLYDLLLNNLELKPSDILVDAYCGIGTIGLSIAHKVKELYGIELIPNAIENAKYNAYQNSIHNAYFKAGKVEEVASNFLENKQINTLIVDPPRNGLETKFIDFVLNNDIPQIGYISCNPHTLQRDLKLFQNNGYEITFLEACDMFPQTSHIEMVAVLKKH